MPATAPRDVTGDRQDGPGCEPINTVTAPDVAPTSQREPLGVIEVALVFGLPLFVALAGVLTWWSVNRVEDRVEADLLADLAEAGISPDEVAIDIRYRDATVTGAVVGGVDADTIEAAAADDLVRDLDVSALTEAPADTDPADADLQDLATGPVRVNVVYDGMTLRVNGTVLNEGQHNVVLETLDLLTGRAEIDENLAISRLAPAVAGADARIADLVVAVESMDLADEWSIRLTDRGLAIEAIVPDAEAAAALGALNGVLTSTPTTIQVTDPTAVEEA